MRKAHFELFGFDFMVDQDFRTWLIEVNTNPYLGKPNQWAKKVLPEMMDETLRIVLDPIYPPRDLYYQHRDFKQRKNEYELIHCEGHISNLDYAPGGNIEIVQFSQRRSFNHDLIYPIKGMKPFEDLSLKALRRREEEECGGNND